MTDEDNKQTAGTAVSVDVVDMHREELPPLDAPEDTAGTGDGTAEGPAAGPLDPETVAKFLQMGYQLEGIRHRHPEIWEVDEATLLEYAVGITPRLNIWAERFPALAEAISGGVEARAWVMFAWDVTFREWMSYKARREEKEAKEAEQVVGDGT